MRNSWHLPWIFFPLRTPSYALGWNLVPSNSLRSCWREISALEFFGRTMFKDLMRNFESRVICIGFANLGEGGGVKAIKFHSHPSQSIHFSKSLSISMWKFSDFFLTSIGNYSTGWRSKSLGRFFNQLFFFLFLPPPRVYLQLCSFYKLRWTLKVILLLYLLLKKTMVIIYIPESQWSL